MCNHVQVAREASLARATGWQSTVAPMGSPRAPLQQQRVGAVQVEVLVQQAQSQAVVVAWVLQAGLRVALVQRRLQVLLVGALQLMEFPLKALGL